MSTPDKASVRDEVSRLKADFNQLNAEGKIPDQLKVLMSSMLLTIDLILLWLRQTHQNNRNSSIPPSKPNRINSPWRKLAAREKAKKAAWIGP
ncbi:hypothetical protein CMK14_14880 [Candidatus Poribacteria bacterium]|nr:hypothetical protein [Candidatus Poribacteria bacterium]